MHRIFAVAAALALLLSLSSCSALRVGGPAAAGGLVGSTFGPVGTGVGSFVGGVGGWAWDDHVRLTEERDAARAELERIRTDRQAKDAKLEEKLADLDRRLRAIPDAPAAAPTVHYGPDLPSKSDKEEESWLHKTLLRNFLDWIGGSK